MADVFRDQDHNLNKIVNADLTLIDPFLLPTGVLLSQDVLGATGITVIDNGDGTVTIGASGPTGPLVGWLDDLSDVDTSTTGPTDGQVLLWNDAIQQWVPGYQAGGLGYRERFNVLDPATQLPLRVVHGLDVVTGVVDVTVAEMGPPTKLVQAEVTILDENTIDVHLPGAVAGSFEVLVLSEGEGSATGPSGPQQLIDEVFVGATDPFVTDPSSTAELWYTPLGTVYPTGPTIPTGILRASVNGAWEVVSGGAALNEVFVGNTDPFVADPAAEFELWYNPDAPTGPATGGGGGATTLDGLTDVDTSTTPPTDKQVLVWDAAAGLWVPGAAGAAATTVTDITTGDPSISGTVNVYTNGSMATVVVTDGSTTMGIAASQFTTLGHLSMAGVSPPPFPLRAYAGVNAVIQVHTDGNIILGNLDAGAQLPPNTKTNASLSWPIG